ncbi:hypothetical protein [Paeniglutamicibacter antarcticus]
MTACSEPSGTPGESTLSGEQQASNSELLIAPTMPTESPSEAQMQEKDTTEAPAVATKAPKDAAEQPAVSVAPTEGPSYEPSESPSYGGVAYEAGKNGVEQIERPGQSVPADGRIASKLAKDRAAGAYDDGLTVSAKVSSQGVVKSEGPGFFTGASYAAFAIKVNNQSNAEVDLSNVVITVLTGKDEEVALPLYGEVEAYDFTGILAPGKSTSTTYAFLVPDSAKEAALHVDLDSRHEAMVLSAKIEAQ